MSVREQVRQKLVLATLEEIERVGLSKVTVRAVANAADVNVAAISYYFGSKATLVEAALSQALAHMFEDLTEMAARLGASPREVLGEMLGYLFEGSHRYPNVTRAHVHDMFTGTSDMARLPQGLAPVVEAVAQTIARAVPLSQDRALLRSVQAFSAILHPALLQGFFRPSLALDTEESRRAYVDELVATAFRAA